MPSLEIGFEGGFVFIRYPPEIVFFAAACPGPLHGFPLQEVCRHTISFFICGSAVEIIGAFSIAGNEQRGEWPAFVFSDQYLTHLFRMEQFISAFVILE